MPQLCSEHSLREQLVSIALAWQQNFGVAPHVTSSLSEFDAAMLLGMSVAQYSEAMQDATAVRKGFDFEFPVGTRIQVKANRPSGKKGSDPSKIGKPKNLDWDVLIWILYDTQYRIVEAWRWHRELYEIECHSLPYLRPTHFRDRSLSAERLK